MITRPRNFRSYRNCISNKYWLYEQTFSYPSLIWMYITNHYSNAYRKYLCFIRHSLPEGLSCTPFGIHVMRVTITSLAAVKHDISFPDCSRNTFMS